LRRKLGPNLAGPSKPGPTRIFATAARTPQLSFCQLHTIVAGTQKKTHRHGQPVLGRKGRERLRQTGVAQPQNMRSQLGFSPPATEGKPGAPHSAAARCWWCGRLICARAHAVAVCGGRIVCAGSGNKGTALLGYEVPPLPRKHCLSKVTGCDHWDIYATKSTVP
jgi:hypothetical protein